MRRTCSMTLVIALVVLVAASMALAESHQHGAADAAGDTGKAITQLETAVTHLGFSASNGQLQGALAHLRHGLNCLDGADGDHYNADWGNPCGKQGSGILSDLGDVPSGVRHLAEAAHSLVVKNAASEELGDVHLAASGAKSLLELALSQLKM